MRPRREFRLIHGELGPDHVLLDSGGHPVIIDIEGAYNFDVELEHSYLAFRFGDHYAALARDDLDSARLRFYRLYHHVSIAAGTAHLLDRGHPARDLIAGILNANVIATLQLSEDV